MENNKQPIVILGAMDCECDLLRSKLENAHPVELDGYNALMGEIDGYPVVLAVCLIGFVNAAVAATLAVKKFNPYCVIVQGTAGAHDQKLRHNDIILGETVTEMSFCVTSRRQKGEGSDIRKWNFAAAQVYKDGAVTSTKTLNGDKKLIDIALSVKYRYGRLKAGNIGSSDCWNREKDRIYMFHETLGTDCEEMEGFAVAQVCARYGVPFLDIRVISNNELDEKASIFNKKTASPCQEYCFDTVKAIIKNI
ncbi:MAG: 5'-methylthioadenosine/S-adenosylhomocysteine nucleosidase [Oscillospiraceae bacterium]|nr:5'-methylthioadenosine/S-adenosylhomocysteine nucleosidase [Candidatus Equicaccousia limihippi]